MIAIARPHAQGDQVARSDGERIARRHRALTHALCRAGAQPLAQGSVLVLENPGDSIAAFRVRVFDVSLDAD